MTPSHRGRRRHRRHQLPSPAIRAADRIVRKEDFCSEHVKMVIKRVGGQWDLLHLPNITQSASRSAQVMAISYLPLCGAEERPSWDRQFNAEGKMTNELCALFLGMPDQTAPKSVKTSPFIGQNETIASSWHRHESVFFRLASHSEARKTT